MKPGGLPEDGEARASPSFINGGTDSPEPDIVFQTEEPMNDVQHHEYVQRCLVKARDLGATFFRVTQHEERPNLILVECWKETPANQGEPRWQAKDS